MQLMLRKLMMFGGQFGALGVLERTKASLMSISDCSFDGPLDDMFRARADLTPALATISYRPFRLCFGQHAQCQYRPT